MKKEDEYHAKDLDVMIGGKVFKGFAVETVITRTPEMRLEDWYLTECSPDDIHTHFRRMIGRVYNHYHFVDGTWVTTSPIAKVNSICSATEPEKLPTLTITTRSGSVYVLGKPLEVIHEPVKL